MSPAKQNMTVVVAGATGLVEMVRGNRHIVNEISKQRKQETQVELVSKSCQLSTGINY